MVPEGRVLHRVLSRQGDAAEQNEEEDQVGEDRVIDNAVALEAEPAWGAGEKEGGASGGKGSGNLGPRSPGLFPWLSPPPLHTQKMLAGLGRGLLRITTTG